MPTSRGWSTASSPPPSCSRPPCSSSPRCDVELTAALHGLAHEQDKRERYVADPAAYAKGFKLTAEQEQALRDLDLERIVAIGAHPLVPFLARMLIQRMRRS
jgi:2,3-dihydroxyphenylpropionate 1,2-dioxygenase